MADEVDKGKKRLRLRKNAINGFLIIVGVLIVCTPILIIGSIVRNSGGAQHEPAAVVVSADIASGAEAEVTAPPPDGESLVATLPPIEAGMTYRYKRQLERELDELLKDTRVVTRFVEDEKMVWIYDVTTPENYSSNVFGVYLGRRTGNETWARLLAGCALEEATLFRRLVIDVEGTKYVIDVEYNDLNDRPIDYLSLTYEYTDLSLSSITDAIRHASNARTVDVTFEGLSRSHTFRLTFEQLRALTRMMRIYAIYRELDAESVLTATNTNQP